MKYTLLIFEAFEILATKLAPTHMEGVWHDICALITPPQWHQPHRCQPLLNNHPMRPLFSLMLSLKIPLPLTPSLQLVTPLTPLYSNNWCHRDHCTNRYRSYWCWVYHNFIQYSCNHPFCCCNCFTFVLVCMIKQTVHNSECVFLYLSSFFRKISGIYTSMHACIL